MQQQVFSIYRSSAGSGKTRTLAKEYLKLALRYRASYFKHILAVTFTNKSTQEMKGRILKYLSDFARGVKNDLATELKTELNLDDNTLQQYSQEVQRDILHNYSQFSVSTIDAFFQRVIRAFTREAGIMGDYTLEMDQQSVIDQVIDQLIDELGSNAELSKWIIQFTEENLEEGNSWDVRHGLKAFANHIFKEEFKLIEHELNQRTAEKQYFQNLLSELQKEKSVFIKTVARISKEGIKIIYDNGFGPGDFKYGKGTAHDFFYNLQNISSVSELAILKVRPQREFLEARHWPAKGIDRENELHELAETKLIPLLKEILDFRENKLQTSLSAELVLKNFYAFGLIADISRKLSAFKKQNNLMLIADAPSFLSGLIQDSDTPFVYEKIGSFYRNYLIDEFQDTSLLQWKNFLPLLKNSLDQGYPGMVVGDVKQSIYRWRGGDLRLLQNGIETQLGEDIVKTVNLQTNYRSAVNVIEFNNLFFKDASQTIERLTETSFASKAFEDVVQEIHHRDNQGYVKLKFFAQESKRKYNEDEEEEEDQNWKSQALDYMVAQIEALQQIGIAARDIALLVRKGEDGKQIAAHLLNYKESEKSKPSCNYEVVSNESLQLSGAASINLICAAMRMLLRWDDPIARAKLAFEYQRLSHQSEDQTAMMILSDKELDTKLPQQFIKDAADLRKMPLYEMAENLIQIFSLHTLNGELPYQFAFMDLILDFSKRDRSDLMSFLNWWEENSDKKSLQLSDDIEAMRIITIHKAKGLQFRYVIIPFCNWSLGHESKKGPMLWVKSELALFKDKGYLPVQYEKAMEQSFFAAQYREERIRAFLDNLNLLYVALTRAEQGMIVISKVNSRLEIKESPSDISQLLFEVLNNNEELFKYWRPEDLTLEMGELQAQASTKIPHENNIQLTQFTTGNWMEKIVVKQNGKHFYEPGLKAKIEKVQYGIKVHEVLSRIRLSTDLDNAVQDTLSEGLMTLEESEQIRTQIIQLLDNPQVSNWFGDQWQVYNEASILLPELRELRVDRLLIRDKQAIVIDYKTGDKKQEDKVQVSEYMLTLKNMDYAVKGYLLYLAEAGMQMEEVKMGAGGKTNQDQLNLNF